MPKPGMDRVSADHTCIIAFCSAIDRPKVAMIEGRGSWLTTLFRMARCRT
jgi:hypothetical protein